MSEAQDEQKYGVPLEQWNEMSVFDRIELAQEAGDFASMTIYRQRSDGVREELGKDKRPLSLAEFQREYGAGDYLIHVNKRMGGWVCKVSTSIAAPRYSQPQTKPLQVEEVDPRDAEIESLREQVARISQRLQQPQAFQPEQAQPGLFHPQPSRSEAPSPAMSREEFQRMLDEERERHRKELERAREVERDKAEIARLKDELARKETSSRAAIDEADKPLLLKLIDKLDERKDRDEKSRDPFALIDKLDEYAKRNRVDQGQAWPAVAELGKGLATGLSKLGEGLAVSKQAEVEAQAQLEKRKLELDHEERRELRGLPPAQRVQRLGDLEAGAQQPQVSDQAEEDEVRVADPAKAAVWAMIEEVRSSDDYDAAIRAAFKRARAVAGDAGVDAAWASLQAAVQVDLTVEENVRGLEKWILGCVPLTKRALAKVAMQKKAAREEALRLFARVKVWIDELDSDDQEIAAVAEQRVQEAMAA